MRADTNLVGSPNKLIWYASQGVFRAGYVDSDAWSRSSADDNSNVGKYSFASGYSTIARGILSTAMGNRTTASGYNSTAIGTLVSTNLQAGSFILGDLSGSSTNSTTNDAANQMMMRFVGGYNLFTNAAANLGVRIISGGNAWQTLSDSTRKENFRPVNDSSILQKIAKLKLGSWNYKGQDARVYCHYGPMAQESFQAFCHDELGMIGEETSINQADFDGINLIANQALIKEDEPLKAENQQLKAKLAAQEEKQRTNHARLDKIEALLQTQTTTQFLSFKP